MTVTATEFKTNFGRYLTILQSEDIYITKNGKTIAKVSNPNVSPLNRISGILEGKLESTFDSTALREERLSKYEAND